MSGATPAGAPEGAGRPVATALWRLRRVLGLRWAVRVQGVKYTERTAEPLHRSLSRHGQGAKEFDVEFGDGPRMRITCTRERVYADLSRPPRLDAFEAAGTMVKPGLRVRVLEGGRGWPGERASRLVGPSGAVVSLDRDEESVKFAQRRYRLRNTAFEIGHVESLKGETEGAFDAAIAIEAFASGEEGKPGLAEVWRVIGPGGVLVLGRRQAPEGTALTESDVPGLGEDVRFEALGPLEGWRLLAAFREA